MDFIAMYEGRWWTARTAWCFFTNNSTSRAAWVEKPVNIWLLLMIIIIIFILWPWFMELSAPACLTHTHPHTHTHTHVALSEADKTEKSISCHRSVQWWCYPHQRLDCRAHFSQPCAPHLQNTALWNIHTVHRGFNLSLRLVLSVTLSLNSYIKEGIFPWWERNAKYFLVVSAELWFIPLWRNCTSSFNGCIF